METVQGGIRHRYVVTMVAETQYADSSTADDRAGETPLRAVPV